MPSQSISALAFDLGDATSNTIYAGVGRQSSFAQLGNNRIGLMRSTDGGQTWQVVNGGGLLTGKNISGIYANGNTVVVSVNVADAFTFSNIGIFRSTNGGATFTQIAVGNGTATGLPGGVSYDLVFDPITPTTLYTSTIFSDLVGGSNGVYKSTNSGANWTRVSTAGMQALMSNNTSNLELATGRNNELYAAIINGGAMAGLFRSPDNGVTWTQMDSPKTNENGTDVGLNPSGGKGPQNGAPEAIAGGQGNIHFSIVADPTNANIVYVGGDRQPRTFGDTGSFPNSIGAQDFSGRLYRGDASKPAGSQFVHLTHRNDVVALPGGGTASNSSPHADSREMTFDAAGNLLETDDGGVYRRTSPRTNAGDWFSMNGNLQVTEAHDVGWDSLSNVAMTGNQDTGSTYQTTEGGSTWNSISTADGGDIEIDNIELAGSNQSVRYSSFQNLGAFRRTTWSATGALLTTTFPALSPLGGAAAISRTFRNPIETNSVAGGRLIIQGSNGLYESLTAGATVSLLSSAAGASNIFANALSYGGTRNSVVNPDVVWAAAGSTVFVRTAGTGAVSPVSGVGTTAVIRDLTVNSNDWSNAMVIDDNQVFQTTNTGVNWSDITGNLFTAGMDIRSIAFVPGPINSAIVVGTNLGIFMMSTLQVGVWSPIGNGMPTVSSYDLEYDATDDILVVATMGRGAWALRDVRSFLSSPSTVVNRGLFYAGAAGASASSSLSDKVALLPGQASSFSNYTNYSRGLNGLVIDVSGLPLTTTNTLLAASLQFANWNGIDVSGFVALPGAAIPTVTIAGGAGVGGAARATITFPDNTLQNTWLRVTVLANATTGLTANDVFYFGNVIGDVNTGNTATRLRVNALDTSGVRNNQSPGANSAGVTNIFDINRDGRVNALDTSVVRNNQQASGIVAPITAPSARAAGSNGSSSRSSGSSASLGASRGVNTAPILGWVVGGQFTGTEFNPVYSESGPEYGVAFAGYKLPTEEQKQTIRSFEFDSSQSKSIAIGANAGGNKVPSKLESIDDFFASLSEQTIAGHMTTGFLPPLR